MKGGYKNNGWKRVNVFEMDTCKRANFNNGADFVSKKGGYKGRIVIMGGFCLKKGRIERGRILFRKEGGC